MSGRFNSKAIVRHGTKNFRGRQFQNEGSIEGRMSKGQHVRDLPKNIQHGVDLYKASTSRLQQKKSSTKTWIDEYEYFNKLRFISSPAVDNQSSISAVQQYIHGYLSKVEQSYKIQNKQGTEELHKKLKYAEEVFEKKYGYLPDTSKKAKSSTSDAESVYVQAIKEIKNNHYPVVYAHPGSTNFEYLSNCINLMCTRSTICFSIDVEAYEWDTKVITEIGISIYDPRENINSIVPLFRNYHLIVSEALHLRNKNWVCDMRECYLLDESLVMTLSECVQFIQSLINFYLIPTSGTEETWNRAIVGHNVAGDLKWLRSLNVNIPDYVSTDFHKYKPHLRPVFVLDTELLYSYCYGSFGSSLGRLLRLFGLPHAFLHNAGNDAHYTLKLLMHMCDINFRKQSGMDDIGMIQQRVKLLLNRSKEEPRVLPMSYSLIMKESNRNKYQGRNQGKPKKEIVHQTEFGGSKWFKDARSAFENTIQTTGKVSAI